MFAAMLLAVGCGVWACTDSADEQIPDTGQVPEHSVPGGENEQEPTTGVDVTIREWDGTKADDGPDTPGEDEDLYWEAAGNEFTERVSVAYDGQTAVVSGAAECGVESHVEGAHVVLTVVKGTEIVLSGKSDDGSLKVYGEKKYKLTLDGVELTSSRGPAVNSQCSKRVFVHLSDGTTNRLADAPVYGNDVWYPDGATASDEDRKGCFFAEKSLIFSGGGVLIVEGRQKHAIATDDTFTMRPGVTIAVTAAAKNALQVKGDKSTGTGVRILGGLLYAHVSSTAGKCIKTDYDVAVAGGRIELNTSGGSEYDAEENDTSSPSGIKAGGNVLISGGAVTIKSTGDGGKGINADGTLTIGGGTVGVATSGVRYFYDEALDLTASPKGIKADGDLVFDGGSVTVCVTGRSDGSEAIESKSTITVNDGAVYCYAYDDAMNASNDITVNGGRLYCYSENNDGIDSNGTLSVTGGLVISSGTSAPEEGFDCDLNTFTITGGVVIGTGGATSTPTSSACTQRSVIYNGIQASKGTLLCIRADSGDPVLIYSLPRTMNGMCLLFSSPGIAQGETYTVLTGGETDAEAAWNGWYSGGNWADGTVLGSFTSEAMVTTAGNSGSGGDRPGGGPGGRF